jgi:hypothetical protein
MDLEETEARNDFLGEGQQQFNRPTEGSILLDVHGQDMLQVGIKILVMDLEET